MRYIVFFLVTCFVVFCGFLVAESGLFSESPTADKPACILLQQSTTENKSLPIKAPADRNERLESADPATFYVEDAPARTVRLGAADPNTENHKTGFACQFELTSKGAAIRKATFSNGTDSEGNATGFDDRNPKDRRPLVILSPARRTDGGEILSMANADLVFVQQQLRLKPDQWHWKSYGVETEPNGTQTARFEATIKDGSDKPAIKLTKIYKLSPGSESDAPGQSYLLHCSFDVNNLTAGEQKISCSLTGPLGLGREAFRSDMRKVVAGFVNSKGEPESTRLDKKKLRKAKSIDDRRLKTSNKFLWIANVNKYFAAIVVPLSDSGEDYCDWIRDKTAWYHDPDGTADSGDETIGFNLEAAAVTLAPAGQPGSWKKYDFQLYLGPKDKDIFDDNKSYGKLGFIQTIDFMPCCCCPSNIIRPLAFVVLTVMKWMYELEIFGIKPIHNYGVVIIILVFLMRLAMHPITKKSQVSMSKLSKLAPKAEEIRKKYANNKPEMNKQMMALYREQGASPIMGFLPMMVQMPMWIALWSAVYASIELRGASFLPVWITDLSVPDAAYMFSSPLTVPLLNWKIESINLLPIMMGLAFYLQQKLMPSQAAASANPQAAQQQKMMMIMLPLMFPLMLYKAPSGVNLYIMASTFAGVIEQYVIRKHIRQKDEDESKGLVAATSKTGGKAKKKKPKPFYKW